MESNVRARVIISGRVQGVFFRMETLKAAQLYGVLGWVRNKADGTVEALFEGENQKLKSLPQKEQKQGRETIKNQFKITTQGLTAIELNNKAQALWKAGKYTDPDRGIAYLNEAIRLDSKYAVSYNNRGLVYIKKGNYDRAISDCDKAIEFFRFYEL